MCCKYLISYWDDPFRRQGDRTRRNIEKKNLKYYLYFSSIKVIFNTSVLGWAKLTRFQKLYHKLFSLRVQSSFNRHSGDWHRRLAEGVHGVFLLFRLHHKPGGQLRNGVVWTVPATSRFTEHQVPDEQLWSFSFRLMLWSFNKPLESLFRGWS